MACDAQSVALPESCGAVLARPFDRRLTLVRARLAAAVTDAGARTRLLAGAARNLDRLGRRAARLFRRRRITATCRADVRALAQRLQEEIAAVGR